MRTTGGPRIDNNYVERGQVVRVAAELIINTIKFPVFKNA